MKRDPWVSYWSRGPACGENVCLPNAEAGIGAVLDSAWRDFARRLPKRARILDLATGNGIVLQRLLAARRDLKLTGVDASAVLPPSPEPIRLIPATPMEELPFGDRSFEAVTSQFGVEYGDTALVASEVGRILCPGGLLCFVLHHRQSPIVSYNLARLDALAWAARESGLLERALRLAAVRRTAAMPTPDSFRVAVEEARRRYPAQPVAAEFAAAIVQTLDMGQRHEPVETIEVLSTLQARSEDEIGRLEALERAACDGDRISAVARALAAAGLTIEPARALTDPQSGAPLAWVLEGREP